MNFELALEYIARRMAELGYGTNYHIRLRYLTLSAIETKILEAFNQLIIIIDAAYNLKIESEMGVFDWTDYNIKDFLFEHTGLITLTNKQEGPVRLQYIQVIPKI